MRTRFPVVLATGAFVLSACSTGSDAVSTDPLLADHGLDGLTAQQIVEELEASTEQRPLRLGASVSEDELLLDDGTTEMALPLPEDEFYLSVAPFVTQTHDCFYHSLSGCQGELVGAEVAVTITDASGDVLVDEEITTHTNGFVGFWLPREITGTIEVSREGYAGSVPFSTTDGSPTCITTLQLDPAAAR
ncbi:CueP family metal-binding protein [Ornithinimicrobium faecis]|uniref:CueP family metal-binding protein n=1 Tax=Ornithinimicrobium faecis TaxID=2934158 RepID=UPI002117A89D|nr:CueP family metal-binding protein [Ornithinimicrobium sp. HY1745]